MDAAERTRERSIALALLGVVLLAGCANVASLDPITLRPRTQAAPDARFAAMVQAAQQAQYEPAVVQPSRHRFAVYARFQERFGPYVIGVESQPDGTVRITPVGPRVEQIDGVYYLPHPLQDEVEAFARLMSRAL